VRRNILCLLASIVCLHAWAQQTPELNEVVVTATRIVSPLLETPSAVSVISSADIAASGAHDLAAVIADQSGVVVNDYGTQGATKSVSLRGSTSSQVLVLLDGTRLNSSRDGMVDFSTIPLEIIDRVEILRGGASTMYGTGAIGGVINIITKKAEKPAISLSVTNGSFIPHAANEVSSSMALTQVPANMMDLVDSQNIELSMAGRLGDIGITGGGSFGRAANAFTWDDTTGINAWRRRTNADALTGSAYAGLASSLFGGQLAVKGVFELSDIGSPGSLTFVSTTARQGDASGSGSLAWKTERFFSDALTFDLKAFYRYDQLTYNDPVYPPESIHRTQTASLDLTQKLAFSDIATAIYGGGAYFDFADSTNLPGTKQRLNLAAFLSVPVSPSDSLTITPTARYDYFSDFAGSLSYSLSAVLLLSERSSLRASLGSAYRVPTLNDLYWTDPYGTLSNPNLKPETSYDGEVGFVLAGSQFSLDVSMFTRLVYDNIIWFYNPTTFITSVMNLTKTLFPGAEVRGKVMLTNALSLEASYSFLYGLLLNDGTTELSVTDNRRVPYAPLHTASAAIRYSGDIVGFDVEMRYVGDEYTDSANTASAILHGYFVANADFSYVATKNVTFTLTGKNLLNSLYYTQLGYPMPPFSIETGVQLHL